MGTACWAKWDQIQNEGDVEFGGGSIGLPRKQP